MHFIYFQVVLFFRFLRLFLVACYLVFLFVLFCFNGMLLIVNHLIVRVVLIGPLYGRSLALGLSYTFLR